MRHREEWHETGKLAHAVNDQYAGFTHEIMTLTKQHCMVDVSGFDRSFIIRVDDVFDPFTTNFVSSDWRARAIANLKQTVFAMHPYYFVVPPRAAERLPVSAASNGNGKAEGRQPPLAAPHAPTPFDQ